MVSYEMSVCASLVYFAYYCLLYIFMLISIKTTNWATNGLDHRGLWDQCSYKENLTLIEVNGTSYYGGMCCSPVKYQGNC